jgi:mRNA interferase RelE/StbE
VVRYEVLIKPSAVRELEELPRRDRTRVIRRIQNLATEPRPHNCEKLSTEEKYRVRQGNYRIIYSVDDKQSAILIVKIGHRKGVYR